MALKHHPTPLSGGDRKALKKELGKARAMANILATQSAEMRAKGEALRDGSAKAPARSDLTRLGVHMATINELPSRKSKFTAHGGDCNEPLMTNALCSGRRE